VTKSSARPTALTTISVRNLEFQARHGATAAERRTHRRFQVDVDLHVDANRAIASDRLADTVDYHAVCALVDEIGTARTYHLLEALAGALLATLRERWPAAAIEVEVRKLNPPCPGNPAWTSVRVRSS
jgi:dihydroneopterin aldolase